MILFVIAALGGGVVSAAPPVQIHIQVIEASKTSKAFDKRLNKLREGIVGYSGAKLVDEVQTMVEPAAAVTLQILKPPQTLKVTLRDVLKDGTVKLTVAIDALKFKANTSHRKNNATVLVAHKTGKDTALFLAVTPKL